MCSLPITNHTTIWNRWLQNARTNPAGDAIVHWNACDEPFRWTYARLIETAEKFAVEMIRNQIARGDVCALIIRHNAMIYPIYMACVRIGAIPAILAYPNPRLHPDKFRQGLEGMSQRSGLDWILTERDLDPAIRPLIEADGSTIKGLHFPLEWNLQEERSDSTGSVMIPTEAIAASDPLLLQHSSGTTGLQKPVVLSHAAVQEHVFRYAQTLRLNQNDKVVSWLPLYHDMGLIAAFHLPLALGVTTIQLNPFDWVLAPSLLLEAISRERGTLSWVPNFAFDMMADKIRTEDLEDLEDIDLRSWRMIINCSEPIRHESHQKFLNRFRPFGLRPSAISTCYAMAETTFAVTQTVPDSSPSVLMVDRAQLAKGVVAVVNDEVRARICVSSGTPLPGTRIRIVDESNRELPEDIVGEIAIQSVSMFDGYRNYPEKTAAVLRDGWYYSGDYGFKRGSDYYVIGRKKDIIIVAGNNIYPEDVETAVGAVAGVIPGRVIAFGREEEKIGTERLCIIAETNINDEEGKNRLRIEIMKAGMAIDVTIGDVYLVPARFLIKSSSGKPSRQANKDRAAALA
jgi:acyl-CoA synthetase (AMP-forming)/AMP-acid ligase II